MNACTNITVHSGASCLLDLNELKGSNRRYILDRGVTYDVEFDCGTLRVQTEPGFIFDGRSGPSCIDWYAPNLGSLDERIAWHMHDCLGYAQSLNFSGTNKALRYVLRDQAGYSALKAWTIYKAVGVSRSWYGRPSPKDWCYANLGKVSTVWVPRK